MRASSVCAPQYRDRRYTRTGTTLDGARTGPRPTHDGYCPVVITGTGHGMKCQVKRPLRETLKPNNSMWRLRGEGCFIIYSVLYVIACRYARLALGPWSCRGATT